MTKSMSRTAAIREARRHITIGAHGRQYVVYMPYRLSDVDGPNTHSNPADWSRAVQTRTRARAELALTLMGVDVEGDPVAVQAEIERASHDGINTVEQIVAHVARRLSLIGRWVFFRSSASPEDSDYGRVVTVHSDGTLIVAWEDAMAHTSTDQASVTIAADRATARIGAYGE